MKPLTKALIEKHFDTHKTIRRRWLGGWWVDLESGARAKITKNGIDFGKYREIENRTNIKEWIFQCEVSDAMMLTKEVFGGVGFHGKNKAEDRVAMLEHAASLGIDTGDQGLVLRHFGPQAEIKYGLFGGWTVRLPNGSAVAVRGSVIEEVRGGGDIFRSGLKLIHELAPDKVVVRGKPAFVLMGINHGKDLNIDVIPESDLTVFYGIVGGVVQFICIAVACCWLDLLSAVIAGYVTGLLLCIAGGRVFWKQLQRLARKRGRAMLGLETTNNHTRKASIDDARGKGML